MSDQMEEIMRIWYAIFPQRYAAPHDVMKFVLEIKRAEQNRAKPEQGEG